MGTGWIIKPGCRMAQQTQSHWVLPAGRFLHTFTTVFSRWILVFTLKWSCKFSSFREENIHSDSISSFINKYLSNTYLSLFFFSFLFSFVFVVVVVILVIFVGASVGICLAAVMVYWIFLVCWVFFVCVCFFSWSQKPFEVVAWFFCLVFVFVLCAYQRRNSDPGSEW